MDARRATWLDFWGKARPGAEAPAEWHALWKHALDVAATGYVLARSRPLLFRHLAGLLGWSVDELRGLWTFALALHDIGKFSRAFQAKAPDFWPAVLGPFDPANRPADPGHAATGISIVHDHMEQPLAEWFPGWDRQDVLMFLGAAIGHHGRPVEPLWAGLSYIAGKRETGAARDFALATADLLQPPRLPPPPPAGLARASWGLAGLAVLADWIGSNQRWFPYDGNRGDPDRYWQDRAMPQAEIAVRAAGLGLAIPAPPLDLSTLAGRPLTPSPIQSWAETVPLPAGPILALIEDVTGGGKTEAALLLAQRLVAAGRARGVHVALPTMATATAMYRRLGVAYRRFYDAGERPSLMLSHGRSGLDSMFRDSILLADAAPATRLQSEETDSAAECASWLADDRRKAFLADIGAGTIDQAILGVLPSKYQALRLAGLAEQVLVVDEAHCYDSYVSAELDRLIAFQAALGGHTIVLSATLPLATRQRLADRWAAALDRRLPLARPEYPCAVLVGGEAPPVEVNLQARADMARVVKVTRSASRAAIEARIAAAVAAGAAVLWVRNTVTDVTEAGDSLAAAGLAVHLFHARFAASDRAAIEGDVIARFGRDGDPAGRRGQVLVASQVAEQSLDVDFDLVVTDLAPIDLILQRMGRLWRHPCRPRPVEGPELLLHSPDPAADVDENWVRAALRGTSFVYRDHLVLWRSAMVLAEAGSVAVPSDMRRLVERVYASLETAYAPAVFERNRIEADGHDSAARSHAAHNMLALDQGYQRDGSPWLDEAKVATRLGDETVTLRLALWDGRTLRPWANDPSPARAWALSEITVRSTMIRALDLPAGLAEVIATTTATWGRHDQDKRLVPLVRSTAETWDAIGLSMMYSGKYGLYKVSK